MFRKPAIAMLLTVALVGCTKKGPGPESEEDFTIPDKVELNEKLLPEVTDEQFESTKGLLTAVHSVNSLREHILVSPDESDKSKARRDELFLKLSDDKRAAVISINSRCGVTDEPAEPKVMSSELNLIEELRTTGNACPALLSKRTQLRWTVLSTDATGESGVVRVYVHSTLRSQYDEPDLARAAGASRWHVETLARGRMEVTPETSRTFARVRGGGVAELTDETLGHMDINLTGEYLDSGGVRELIMYVKFSIREKTFQIAFHSSEDEDGLVKLDQFFIGNRKLSDEEMENTGVNDLARILLN